VIGGYRLQRRLGSGGMGDVWLAEHSELKVERAVKLLPPLADAEALLRFRREAETMASLDHPHVARIHASGESQGQPYLVMDLLRGGSLEDLLDSGPLAPEQAASIVRQLAQGLKHMHDRGVLHRDIKPANVQLDERGDAQWIDFGLARSADAHSLTKTGTVLGTPAYMAPEQAKGDRSGVDARSDVYGLGAVLYHCLTGRAPFGAGSMVGLLSKVLTEAPLPVLELAPHTPPHLASLCERALAKAPADRFASAAELLIALDHPDRRPSPGPRRALLLGALGLACALGLAFVAALSRPTPEGAAQSPPATQAPPSALPSTQAAPSPAEQAPRSVVQLEFGFKNFVVPAFDEQGRLLVAGSAGELIVHHDLEGGGPQRRVRLDRSHPGDPPLVLLVVPGGYLVGGGAWGYWVPDGGEAAEVQAFRSAALHPDGWVLLGCKDGLYRLRLPAGSHDPELLTPAPGRARVPTSVACDDEIWVAWGVLGAGEFHGKAARLDRLDLQGQRLRTFSLFSRFKEIVRAEPGGRWLAGSSAGQLYVLPQDHEDPQTWETTRPAISDPLGTFALDGAVRGLAVAGPPGARVVYAASLREDASADVSMLRAWSWPDGELLLHEELKHPPSRLAVSHDDAWLAVGTRRSGKLWLHPLEDGRPAW
jgi:hypothetical protein